MTFRSDKDAQTARDAAAHARKLAYEAEQRGDTGEKNRHMERAMFWELKAEEYDNYGEDEDGPIEP